MKKAALSSSSLCISVDRLDGISITQVFEPFAVKFPYNVISISLISFVREILD